MFTRRKFLLLILGGTVMTVGSFLATDNGRQGKIVNAVETVKQNLMSAIGIAGGLPILMYHHLVPDLTEYEGNESIVSVEQFQEQMKYLAQEGFTTLTIKQLQAYLAGEEIPEKSVVITFDDGNESNYIYAYPILKELGLHAIINIIVGLTPGEKGTTQIWVPKLSWEQMTEMIASGTIDIQSHTYDLHYFGQVNQAGDQGAALAERLWLPEESRVETEEEYSQRVGKDLRLSKELIEERLGQEVSVIAYPFGEYSEIMLQIAKEEIGFEMGFVVAPGYVKLGDNPWFLKRINVSPQWDLDEFVQAVNGKKAFGRIRL